MKNYRITVVMPVYNVAEYVERCLRSVMHQKFPATECIIVDDGSTDDSIDRCQRMIEEYHGHTQFIILHHEHNLGLSATRNTGTKAATGEYIYYVDSDDEITSDCLERMVEPVRRNNSLEMVVGEYKSESSDLKGMVGKYAHKISHFSRYTTLELRTKEEVKKYYYGIEGGHPDQGWNKLLRLSFIRENNLYFKEGLLYEDLLWSHYLYNCVSHVVFIPYVTYIHHRRQGSIMTKTGKEEYLQHHGYIFKEIAEKVEKKRNGAEAMLRWMPDFCHCYIDSADNPDYNYAYQVFKQQLCDGHHRLASFELKVVNSMSKCPIGRTLYKSYVWSGIQIQRIISVI